MGEVAPKATEGALAKVALNVLYRFSSRFAAIHWHPSTTSWSPSPLKRGGWGAFRGFAAIVYHKAALPKSVRRHLCGEAADRQRRRLFSFPSR